MTQDAPAIGIIGGSGLYQMEGVENPAEQRVNTSFGEPSDAIIGGRMQGRQVYFLPRHGRGHRLLPHELNHRANIYALRSLNVTSREALFSTVHGAGRIMSRTAAKGKFVKVGGKRIRKD